MRVEREAREETGEGRSSPESLILCLRIKAARSTGDSSVTG